MTTSGHKRKVVSWPGDARNEARGYRQASLDEFFRFLQGQLRMEAKEHTGSDVELKDKERSSGAVKTMGLPPVQQLLRYPMVYPGNISCDTVDGIN